MKMIAAIIASVLALTGVFFLGRYTVGKVPYATAKEKLTGWYHQAKDAVTGWFKSSPKEKSEVVA